MLFVFLVQLGFVIFLFSSFESRLGLGSILFWCFSFLPLDGVLMVYVVAVLCSFVSVCVPFGWFAFVVAFVLAS